LIENNNKPGLFEPARSLTRPSSSRRLPGGAG
jgi:hypothetical protein